MLSAKMLCKKEDQYVLKIQETTVNRQKTVRLLGVSHESTIFFINLLATSTL